MYDAIVVGAGPAGSHVAGRLAGSGHQVLVLEQHETIGKATCCAGILGKECLEFFPAGKPAVLREAGSARFFAPSGDCVTLKKDTPQAYIVDRISFDVAMARSAEAHGVEYLLGTRVANISIANEHVQVEAEQGRQSLQLKARTVVIASGFGSKLPERLGLGKAPDFVMGAQAEVEAGGIDQVEVYFGSDIAPGFFAWLVPTSGGRALAGLLARRHTGRYLRSFLERLSSQGKVASGNVEIRYGGIPLRPLPRTSTERVVVVGDAAGQVKPTTAGGVYYGLICADIAAGTLEGALDTNDLSAGTLAGYDREWHRALSRELRLGRWARWLHEKLNDRQVERLLHIIGSERVSRPLLDSPDFSFDRHGQLMLRALRQMGPVGIISLLWLLVIRR